MMTTTTDQLSNDIGNGDDDGDDDGGDRGDGDGGRDEPDGPFHDKQARIAPKGSKPQRPRATTKTQRTTQQARRAAHFGAYHRQCPQQTFHNRQRLPAK